MSGVKLDRRSAMRTAAVVRRVERMPFSELERPEEGALESVGAIFAEITVVGSAGEYEAKEQLWDGSAFADFAGARVWDGGSNLSKLQEINLSTGVFVGTIIQPWYTGDDSGGNLWMFLAATSTETPFAISTDPAVNTNIKIGANRAAAGYPFKDAIILGTSTDHKTTAETLAIAAGVGLHFIYYEFTGATSAATLKEKLGYPTQVQGTFRVVLGSADVGGSSVVNSVKQIWWGDIHFPTRFFFGE